MRDGLHNGDVKRLLLVAAIVVGVSLLWVRMQHGDSQQTYTVAQVAIGLRQHPTAWVGRTLFVHGWFRPSFCPTCGPSFLHADASGDNWYLLIDPGGRDPMRDFLRHVPLLGRVVPGPQIPQQNVEMAYRITLIHARPSCYRSVCIGLTTGRPLANALLVDAQAWLSS